MHTPTDEPAEKESKEKARDRRLLVTTRITHLFLALVRTAVSVWNWYTVQQ